MRGHKLEKVQFRSHHVETLHNNSEDIEHLMERINDLEYLHERGMVSRQLISLNVVTTTVCGIFAVLWFLGKLSGSL